MARDGAGVADVFRRAGGAYRERMAGRLDAGRLKVMTAIEACRSAALGGHIYACDGCGREHPLYNSCRNRHCPTCQGLAANRWSEARAAELLPVPYFHVVFTLPAEIAAIACCNRKLVFDILFRTVAETLRTIAADPRHGGLRIGGTAVLHTRDQKLRFHPHVHVVVPNAGFDVEGGAWKTGGGTWLAPVKVLASLFRRRVLEELARAHRRGRLEFHGSVAHLANPGEFHAALAAARRRGWVVYAKRPFRGPEQVFRYLRPLHPQDRNLGQPHHGLRRPDRLLPIPKAEQDGAEEAALRHHDRLRRRVHPPLPARCPARRNAPHPSLRHPRQRMPGHDAGERAPGSRGHRLPRRPCG